MKSAAWVVDCSAWVAFYLREERAESVDAIISMQISGSIQIHAPALLAYELHNSLLVAVRRGRCTAANRDEYLHGLAAIPVIKLEQPDWSSLSHASVLAQKHSLTHYDATYLELAERLGAKLKTFDKALLALKDTYPWID